MEVVRLIVAALPPIHFFCWDCGAPFALTVDALKRDDLDPSCPVCDSLRIGADYESLVRWFDACGAGSSAAEARSLRPA
jgi:hypothetical protein